MAETYGPPTYAPPGTATTAPVERTATDGSSGQGSTKDIAKEQAAGVGQQAAESGQHVAEVAKEQTAQVASEIGRQASDLLGQAQGQVKQQANAQQQRLAGSLRSISEELSSMSSRAENPGLASDLAREAASRTGNVAQWLESREPGGVLEELSGYARRRPGTFLAVAAGIGLIAGRLTRGLKDQQQASQQSGAAPSWSSQAGTERPMPTPYPTAGIAPSMTPTPMPDMTSAPTVDLSEPPLAPVSPAPYAGQVRR